MISPILQNWLSFSSNDDRLKKLIHSRAAVSILACFTLDDVKSRGSSHHACLNDDMKRLLVSGMVFQFEESSVLSADNICDTDALAQLLGPMSVLIRYQSELFELLVDTISQNIANLQNVTSFVSACTNALILLLKSKVPTSLTGMMKSSRELE